MPQRFPVRRLAAPLCLLTVLVVFGCDAGQVLGPPQEPEIVVAGQPVATQVVSVEDSLPKPPRYSPVTVNHGVPGPYDSLPPDPTPTPKASPTPANPSPSPAPSPLGTASTSPSPSTAASAAPVQMTGNYTAVLLAGGNTGTFKLGKGNAATLGSNSSSAALAVVVTGNSPSAVLYPDGAANQLLQATLPDGTVTSLAGDPNGTSTGNDNFMSGPGGAAFDPTQNVYYVADTGHNRIARVTPPANSVAWVAGPSQASGFSSSPTFADGNGSGSSNLATFFAPRGLAVDPAVPALYVADSKFHIIRKIDLSKTPSVVSTIAGQAAQSGAPASATASETAAATKFNTPSAVALSIDKKTLFVADTNNNVIRAIDLAGGNVTVVAGTLTAGNNDGPAASATFTKPCALAADVGHLYVGEQGTPRLRVIDLNAKTVSTALGGKTAGKAEGKGSACLLTAVTGLSVSLDNSGNATAIYAYDAGDGTTNGARLLLVTP